MFATVTVGARTREDAPSHRPLRGKVVIAALLAASVAFGGASACAPRVSGDVVRLAAQQEGKPYVYGAAGPSSFDCSGLVQYVFRQAGRLEPRTAQQQYIASRHLSVLQAGRGDLVFWGAPFSVYHVGIYLGNGQMIDAAHTGTRVRQERVWPGASYGRLVR